MQLPTIDPLSSDRYGAGPADPWQQVWSHHEQLLRVARRRSASIEDAEDAVHEAMVRAVENSNVDSHRLGAWLTSVTIRLCVDRYRQLRRDTRVALCTRSMLTAPGAVSLEDAVCDRAEAKWLALRGAELPERQAEALRLKSENLDVAQVAQRMGLTPKAVESLLTRARRTLRAALAGTLAVAVGLWRGRPHMDGGAPTATLACTAVTLVIVGLVVLPPYEADGATSPQPRMSPSVSPPASYRDSQSPSAAHGQTAPLLPVDTGSGPALPGQVRRPAGDRPTATNPPRSDPTATAAESESESESVEPAPEPSSLLVGPLPELPTLPAVPAAPDLPTLPPLPVVGVPTDVVPALADREVPSGSARIDRMCATSLNSCAGQRP